MNGGDGEVNGRYVGEAWEKRGGAGRCGEMRTWPVSKAPWTVPLYAADVCSPAKKSLHPTLRPKAFVMVFFEVPAMIKRSGQLRGRSENGTANGGSDGLVDAPTATYVYAPFARGLARQAERTI